MKRLLKWLSIGVTSLLALGLAGGAIYQATSESGDLARYPAPGEFVAVDGALMHIHCLGQGSPAVVLEQGLNGMASAWGELHDQMSLLTRVCTYDRAGLGYSEPIDHPTRAPEVAERLTLLLRGAEIEDNLILAGWSAGGVYIREFQRQHPDRVKAMLFIESSHEQQTKRYPAPLSAGGDSMLRVARHLAPIGLVRLSGMVEGRFASFRGPDELRARLIALYQQSHVVGTMLRESEAFNHDIDGAPPTQLGDLPLIVLSQGKPTEVSDGASPEEIEYRSRKQAVEQQLQRELTALSTRGRQIIATESGHGIHADQPELVIEALRELLRVVREEQLSG